MQEAHEGLVAAAASGPAMEGTEAGSAAWAVQAGQGVDRAATVDHPVRQAAGTLGALGVLVAMEAEVEEVADAQGARGASIRWGRRHPTQNLLPAQTCQAAVRDKGRATAPCRRLEGRRVRRHAPYAVAASFGRAPRLRGTESQRQRA